MTLRPVFSVFFSSFFLVVPLMGQCHIKRSCFKSSTKSAIRVINITYACLNINNFFLEISWISKSEKRRI